MHRVSFEWQGPAGQHVELAGDFADWKYPVRMEEVRAGHYRCVLELEPGVYRYKFRVDRAQWVSDPAASHLDGADGYGNGLLVVGGARWPLVFAPDRRHVCVREDGSLTVQLELAGDMELPSLWLRAAGAGQRVELPLEVVASQGTHRLLRASSNVPSAGPTLLGFSGCGSGQEVFELPERRALLARPPAWAKGAVFYSIFVDRWHRGSQSPAGSGTPRDSEATASTFFGGDLDGVREGLPYLKALGVDAVVLTPVHRSPTPHRYDAVDLLTVDPALGGDAALRRLIEAAHALGLRLVVDFAPTHVNEQHPAFQDLLRLQERSAFVDWFRVKRFPVRARDPSTFENYYDRLELPWLNLRPGPARAHVFAAARHLVELGVDGLRFDAMNDAPGDFWRELRAHVRAVNPELLLLGEIVSDNLARFAEIRGVDVATDFRHREAMLAFFARGSIDAPAFWQRTVFDEFRTGAFDRSFRLLFLDNHDTWRFLSVAFFADQLRLALAYLYFRPEPIALHYGTELHLAGGVLVRTEEHDDAWPERTPMPPLDSPRNETWTLVQALGRLRRALPHGELRLHHAASSLLVLERPTPTGCVRAYFNAGSAPVTVEPLPPQARVLLSANERPAQPDAPLASKAARFVELPGAALR